MYDIFRSADLSMTDKGTTGARDPLPRTRSLKPYLVKPGQMAMLVGHCVNVTEVTLLQKYEKKTNTSYLALLIIVLKNKYIFGLHSHSHNSAFILKHKTHSFLIYCGAAALEGLKRKQNPSSLPAFFMKSGTGSAISLLEEIL